MTIKKAIRVAQKSQRPLTRCNTYYLHKKYYININIMSYIKLIIQTIQVQCDKSPGEGGGGTPSFGPNSHVPLSEKGKRFPGF